MDYFDILLARNLANKGDITTESLSVTQNGTYTAPQGKAYTPVTVSVQPPANSYQLKSITTPTSLATFEASEMPMPSLKASIKAKQDLHGYDKPWVGGAGKNKFDQQTAYSNIDGGVKYFPINVGDGTFTMSTNCPKNGDSTNLFFLEGNVSSGASTNINGVWSGHNITISSANGYVTVGYRNQVVNPVNYNTQVEKGSSATTFAPYSNICPISGWDNAIVTDTDDVDNPTITQTTTISLGQTVYGGELDVINGASGNKITHGIRQGFTRGALDSSGKLYKLTPTLDDVAVWTDASNASTKIMSNMFEVKSLNDARTATTPSISQYNTSLYVGGYVGDEATLDALLSDLQVKYELATPTTLTTQPTPIKSLNGINNLSVDCGEILEGEYFKALTEI